MKKGAPAQVDKVELVLVPSKGLQDIITDFKGSIEVAKFVIDDVIHQFDKEI
jgi:hypothetical protein